MNSKAFTLVEMMIVIAVIALLAAITVPNLLRAQRNARIAAVANSLKKFSEAFQMYMIKNGQYPPDTHIVLPAGMDEYIHQAHWDKEALGGNYNWEGPSWSPGGTYPYTGISITNTTADNATLAQLDAVLDDGDLSTGKFRQTPNGRYTYIWEE